MSVVACRVSQSSFEIASDSITVRGYTQTKGQTSTHSKLYETNDVVVGSVGSAEENSMFRLFVETHRPAQASEHAMLEFMAEFSDWKKKRMDRSSIENAYMIGFSGAVYTVESWHVERIKSYMAIGAGMDFALAALYLGTTAKKAVETAIELSIFCEAPILVIEKSIQQPLVAGEGRVRQSRKAKGKSPAPRG
jgi:ATP-dependent protease HslVU (ClpYQ) peptidase subunit